MGLKKPNESVLEEIESQYAYDPYNNAFVFKVAERFLAIPLAFPEDGDCELILEQSYDLDSAEIENVLTRMIKGHEELMEMAMGE